MPSTNDIRGELEERMTVIQKDIGDLQAKRVGIDQRLQEKEAKLSALRVVYEIEAERLGEPKIPLFARKGAVNRFKGMKLIDAVSIVRQEQPEINKKQARGVLEKANFDFRGKRPGTAIHFVWIALDRRGKPNLKRLAQKVARIGRDK